MADIFPFRFVPLDKELLLRNLEEMIDMARRNISDEYWTSQHFLHELKDKWLLSFLLFNNDDLIGFIIASRKEHSVHIHKFIVDEKMQRRGAGTLMLYHLLHSVNDSLTLKVNSGNLKALAFYKKHGFEQVGSQQDLLILQLNR